MVDGSITIPPGEGHKLVKHAAKQGLEASRLFDHVSLYITVCSFLLNLR